MKTKLFLYISALVLLVQATNAQTTPQPEVVHDDFIGKVKTCLQTVLKPSADASQGLKQFGFKILSYYDLTGNKTELITFDAHEKVFATTKYQYNALRLYTGYISSRGTSSSKITYTFANNYTIQTISYNSGGYLTRKLDAHYKIVEIKYFAPDNQLIETTDYQYDAFGNKIGSKTLKNSLVIAQSIFTYNSHHKIIQTKNYSLFNNKLILNDVTSFNNGNIIKNTHYESSGKITSIDEYTYPLFDGKGNWTERNQTTNGKFVAVMKRVFSYYK